MIVHFADYCWQSSNPEQIRKCVLHAIGYMQDLLGVAVLLRQLLRWLLQDGYLLHDLLGTALYEETTAV